MFRRTASALTVSRPRASVSRSRHFSEAVDEMSRRIKHWVLFLCVLCTAAPFTFPFENCAAAGELASTEQEAKRPSLSPGHALERTAPQKAYDLLAALQRRDGTPLPGYIGGNTFRNRERRLPHGRYREYDVNRKRPGRPRDAERLVIEQESGKAYYTADHYRTFIPLN